jgi:hypothetical protein
MIKFMAEIRWWKDSLEKEFAGELKLLPRDLALADDANTGDGMAKAQAQAIYSKQVDQIPITIPPPRWKTR